MLHVQFAIDIHQEIPAGMNDRWLLENVQLGVKKALSDRYSNLVISLGPMEILEERSSVEEGGRK